MIVIEQFYKSGALVSGGGLDTLRRHIPELGHFGESLGEIEETLAKENRVHVKCLADRDGLSVNSVWWQGKPVFLAKTAGESPSQDLRWVTDTAAYKELCQYLLIHLIYAGVHLQHELDEVSQETAMFEETLCCAGSVDISAELGIVRAPIRKDVLVLRNRGIQFPDAGDEDSLVVVKGNQAPLAEYIRRGDFVLVRTKTIPQASVQEMHPGLGELLSKNSAPALFIYGPTDSWSGQEIVAV